MIGPRRRPVTGRRLLSAQYAALFVAWLDVVPDEVAAWQGGQQLVDRQLQAERIETAMDTLSAQMRGADRLADTESSTAT